MGLFLFAELNDPWLCDLGMRLQPDDAVAVAGRLPYFSSEEVAQHNVSDDCWVSYFNKVYNLTALIREHRGNSVFVL
jgi:hypothetical protein